MWRFPVFRKVVADEIGVCVSRYIAWKAAVQYDSEMMQLWSGTKTSLDNALVGPVSIHLPAKVVP